MKIVGLITEYNPFHLGHKLHLKESLNLSGATHSICIMSGSFVQRGEPAITDKWTRARMAVENGVDLVIELPFVYAVQSAEMFSFGAVRILDATNVVTHLAFGSEVGNVEPLSNISDLLVEEPVEYRRLLKKNLSEGYSYPVSRSRAISGFKSKIEGDSDYYHNMLLKSNNILGIEYLKALKKLNSRIMPVTFRRVGHAYKDTSTHLGIASATAIRSELINKGLESVRHLVPSETFTLLSNYESLHHKFNTLNNYTQLIRYSLLSKSNTQLTKFLDMESGLENRLIEHALRACEAEALVKSVTTKRYTSTRIRRILIHILADLNRIAIENAMREKPEYVRILASNSKGFEILNEIKKKSGLSIITKFSDMSVNLGLTSREMLEKEVLATNLYFLGLNNNSSNFNLDYTKTPYIMK
jgi:predicted nucleotidyltransferase